MTERKTREIEKTKDADNILLETVTGKLVDVSNPQSDEIDINDIAWGLSRIPRFCGATITEVPYNVGQHSIFVANEVKNIFLHPEQYPELYEFVENLKNGFAGENVPDGMFGTILKGLLHDGSEAYIGDIPSPVKRIPQLHTVIKAIENRLSEVILLSFNLHPVTDFEYRIIKHADKIAQKIEAHAFMQSRGKHWKGLPEVSLEKLQQFTSPITAIQTYREFMKMFNEYSSEIEAARIEAYV